MVLSEKVPTERELRWRDRPLIMGVLNVTPDSFYDGGKYTNRGKAVSHALHMEDDGADIIDVGGESSRPFSKPVSVDEELKRVIPVVEGIRERSEIFISVDTCKAEVARQACLAGADIVNDITALRGDQAMAYVVSDLSAYVVIMHMRGTPENMQVAPGYDDVIGEICSFFEERIEFAASAGIRKGKLIVDPGIGFGKRVEDNLRIIKHLETFSRFDLPILIGTSMKSFIGAVTDSPVQERIEGTLASIALAVWNGAHIVRVHDVQKARKVLSLVNEVRKA